MAIKKAIDSMRQAWVDENGSLWKGWNKNWYVQFCPFVHLFSGSSSQYDDGSGGGSTSSNESPCNVLRCAMAVPGDGKVILACGAGTAYNLRAECPFVLDGGDA